MRTDKLFLSWDCPDCVKVKMHAAEVAVQDHWRGTANQALNVFLAFSSEAAREILDQFGLINFHTPILLTWDGRTLARPESIIAYLKSQGIDDNPKDGIWS